MLGSWKQNRLLCCVSFFPAAVIQASGKSSRRKVGPIPARYVTGRLPWRGEHGARNMKQPARPPALREQRETDAGAQVTRSFLFSLAVVPTLRMRFPSLVKACWTQPRRHTRGVSNVILNLTILTMEITHLSCLILYFIEPRASRVLEKRPPPSSSPRPRWGFQCTWV